MRRNRSIDQRTVVTLGVAGGTGSGKTTVANAILDAVGRERIAYLAQDSYYRDIAWTNSDEVRSEYLRSRGEEALRGYGL